MTRSSKVLIACHVIALTFLIGVSARGDDGYRLWLRYDPLPPEMIKVYRSRVTHIVAPGRSATLDAIRTELIDGCGGLLGSAVPLADEVERDGAVVVGTPQ